MDTFVTLIFIIVIMVFSTVLHELAHGYVAYWLGDHTAKANGRLSFNPIVHIDPFMSIIVPVMLYLMGAPVFGGAKPVPINTKNLKWREWGFALVAIAGPLTNLILSFIFFLLWFFLGGNVGNSNEFLLYGLQINICFALFNILPIPPLDGSRVLYALAPDFARNFMRKIEPFGIFIVYILVFLAGSWFSAYILGAEEGILRAYLWIVGVR